MVCHIVTKPLVTFSENMFVTLSQCHSVILAFVVLGVSNLSHCHIVIVFHCKQIVTVPQCHIVMLASVVLGESNLSHCHSVMTHVALRCFVTLSQCHSVTLFEDFVVLSHCHIVTVPQFNLS